MSDVSAAGAAESGAQFWFNTATGEVEVGRRASWEHLLGPYETREEAQQALSKARERSQAWDDDDEAWRDA